MIKLQSETIKLLEDIERRIDPETEDDLLSQYENFALGKFEGDLFKAKRKKLTPVGYEHEPVHINDAIVDLEKMFVNQMWGVSKALDNERSMLTLRANYGTGIMTSLFGAEIFTMPRHMGTLPTTKSFNDTDKMREILQAGMPDLNGGFGGRVFEMGELCAEVFAQYPKIQKYVTVYHPDTQGPLDVLELLWGSEMFYSLYDEPELAHDLLNLVTDTYIAFMEKWYKIFPGRKEWSNHWGTIAHKGKLMIRNDSAMNLSPDMYEEFAMPYDAKLLEHFGGGLIHFCGRGDHYIEVLSRIPYLYGINMSQPHLNDMEKIYANTVDKGIGIYGLNEEYARKDVVREGGFHHLVCL